MLGGSVTFPFVFVGEGGTAAEGGEGAGEEFGGRAGVTRFLRVGFGFGFCLCRMTGCGGRG